MQHSRPVFVTCVKAVAVVLIYNEELLPHLQYVNTDLVQCNANGNNLNTDKFVPITPAIHPILWIHALG